MRSIEGFCVAAALASLLGASCTPFVLPKLDGGSKDAVGEVNDSGGDAPYEGYGPTSDGGEVGPDDVSLPTDLPSPAVGDGGLDEGAKDAIDTPETVALDGESVDADAGEVSPSVHLPKVGLLVQLEADYGLAAMDTQPISKWRDGSGNGSDATETNPALQPAFLEDVNACFGAAVFGVAPGQEFELPRGFADLQGGVSMFFVLNLEAPGGAILFLTNPNGPTLALTSDTNTNQIDVDYHVGPGSTAVGFVDSFQYGGWHLFEAIQQAGPTGGTASFTVYFDGTALATGTQSVPTTEVKTAQIGPMLGQALMLMQAAIIYSRPVSNEDRKQIESYLMSKWAISP
jgi:hypothetical protein